MKRFNFHTWIFVSQELHRQKVEPGYPNERSLSFLSNMYFKGRRNLDYIPKERTVPSSNRENYSRSYSYEQKDLEESKMEKLEIRKQALPPKKKTWR